MTRFFSRIFIYLIPFAAALAFNAHAETKSSAVNWLFVPPAVQQTIMQNVGAGNRMDKVYYLTDEDGKVTYQAIIKKADGSSADLLVEQSGRLLGNDGGKSQSDNTVARPKILIPFEEGSAAYSKGDYQRAAKILTPWAEQGNVSAQTMLGSLFMEGKGVEEDFEQARRWYRMAAEQGSVNAQYNMAIMCYNGDGGEQDDVEAYMWFAVAAKNGNKAAARQLKPLSRKMPVDAFKEAQRRAAEWKPGTPSETETDAAE